MMWKNRCRLSLTIPMWKDKQTKLEAMRAECIIICGSAGLKDLVSDGEV